MRSKLNKLYLLLILSSLFIFASADFEDIVVKITSVSTIPGSTDSKYKYVSMQGGAYIYIKGSGFSSRSPSSNRVTVADIDCPIIEFLTTSTQVVCQVPPSNEAKTATVKVFVDDNRIGTCSSCYVVYNYWYTPLFAFMMPNAGNPGQEVNYYGRPRVTTSEDVDYVKIGDYRCDTGELNDFDAVTFDGNYRKAPCNVPTIEAGYYNVSQKVLKNTGFAAKLRSLPVYRPGKDNYEFAVVPKISSISNNKGSSEGQIITVKGTGFSSSQQNEVNLADTPCKILKQSDTEIQCELQPRSTPIPEQGYHAGLRFAMYKGKTLSQVKGGTAGTPTYTQTRLSGEIGLNLDDTYSSKLNGYFKAPVTGNYKFVVSTDDIAQLLFGKVPGVKTGLELIVNIPSATGYRFFNRYSTTNQVSSEIPLVAGNYYYMELIHQEGTNDDYATIGVIVPNSENTVNTVPEIVSMKITCPTISEVMEFKLTNATGGRWKIRLDYLSSDGKKIDSSISTTDIVYNVAAATLQNQIYTSFGLRNTVTREMLRSDGTVTTVEAEAKVFRYEVTFQSYRKNGILPAIDSPLLTGSQVSTKVTQLRAPSAPVRGSFTVNAKGKSSVMTYTTSAWDMENKLRDLGYLDPMRIVINGEYDTGVDWRIQFSGDLAPVDQITVTDRALTGCSDPSRISIDVTRVQTASNDLFYEVIPSDYLFTAEQNPQITIKSNGVTGNCPDSNCDYVIQNTGIPEITNSYYAAPTLTLAVDGVTTGQYTQADVHVFFGNTECTVTSYNDASIPASLITDCPVPEAGDFTPKVHFNGLGYAKTNSIIMPSTIDAVISGVTPNQVNANGGTVLIITGTGFPASLSIATQRGMQVKIGSTDCKVSSVTPTQIVCTNTQIQSGASLTVSLNGKTATSSVLTLLNTVPTINSISPDSVNPVLQTNIVITGTNFDATAANTKIYLSTSSNPKVTECLPISSSATQITCKLLGAPTGSYNLYVQTSAGYSNSKAFSVKTVITEVSPSSGSAAGGTILTIQGGTFSTDKQQTLVFIGGQNIACDVISSTASQVECKTRAKPDSYDESPQQVALATRIVEEAVCDTGVTCSFAYSDALTPKVTALGASTVSPGDSLQITGTGFESVPAGSLPQVTINGVDCAITSNTDTDITLTVPATFIPTKTAVLIVNVAGKGDAKFVSVNSTIQVTPKITSVTPTSGASTGTLITVNGFGFQSGTTIKVGTGTCAIRSISSTAITCKSTSSGEVSLTSSDFTGIKCSPACSVTLSSSLNPTITSVTPLIPTDATAFSLTIVGTKFNTGTVTVNLIGKTDKTIIFTGSVTTNTATQIEVAFTNIAAGQYNVEVLIGTNAAVSSGIVDLSLSATVSTSLESSIAGGATLTITGAGFFDNTQKDKNKVTVCGFPCKVTQSTGASLQCQAPLFINAAVKSAYPNLVSTSKLKPALAWSDASKQDNVLDLAFTTVYTSTKTDCYIGLDFGVNLLAEVSEIKYFPDPAITASKLSGTIIEGSNDNTTFTTIATIDANAHDGWNSLLLDSNTPARYRYYRLRGATSTAKCALAELQFFGVALSDSTITDLEALNCKAEVTVSDKVQTIDDAVTYKQSKTPILTTVSPAMGTTAGGTTLTLTGTGFVSNTNDVQVLIDGVPCDVATASTTEITCVTRAAPAIANRKSSLKSELTIQLAGQGNVVVGNNKYFYVDRWSEMNTWGGITPPREGESVSIPAGQTILLDVSPPILKAIIIEGALIFNDQDLTLDAEYIFIRNGRMQIGTRENPIQSKITVTLHGTKESPQLPTFGNKVIAMMEGVLDIHGKERSHTWTVLDATANAGDTSITVQGAVDWVAGEEIVIASTDHDHYQSETRKIASVTKNAQTTTITFTEPLKNKHYAGIQNIDGVTFEMRAEVGLLTRNVVIQGDDQSQKLQYGVHIMAHSSTGDDSSIARISYTEVRQAGQAFNLGRYAIHLHLIGNVRESYILGNAVHHSYNRAVTIHGVHFLKVQKNVAYWIMGHTIFIEDGIETHNVIEDNLVINTMASTALLNTDQTPASFWITNPNNIWRRNHAAGSDRYGFWFDLREHPEGPSATLSICPTGEALGEFVDNQAHSNVRYGLRIFHEMIPRTYPCLPYTDPVANPPIQAEFKNFLGWKNMRDAIIGERLGAVKFKNVKAADNKRAGIEISDGNRSPADTLLVEDAWIVGKTPDNAGDDSVYVDGQTRGLITPKVDFFLARNVHFSNFGASMTAIETCSHCEHPAATDAGARTSYFEGLTFSNVVQRVRFNIPFKEILVDRDGSLTGTSNKGVVTYYYDHLDVPGCTRNEDVYNGLVCDQTVTIRRVEFLGLVPFASFEMQNLEIFRVENNPNAVYGHIPYRLKTRKSWATPFVTGYSYKLNWASRADFTEMVISPSEVINNNDKSITISFNHSEYRELFDVFPQSTKVNITNTTTLWDTTSADSLSTGDWYHDAQGRNLYMVINSKNKQDIVVQAVKCRVNCPQPPSSVPKEGLIRPWSNATQWPNQRLPQDGEDVEIPANWIVKLDINTAKLGTLHILGDLYFDDTKDNLTLTADKIWVEGQMVIGSDSVRFTKKARIVLTGQRNSTSLILGGIQDVSNKVLAVTGNLTMIGGLVNNVYVRLQTPAKKGTSTIIVPTAVDWKAGDEIVISPTQRTYNEYEVRKILTISDGIITLDSPLQYYHFGGNSVTKTTAYGNLDMRAEVGLLTRNIVIEGSAEDLWGGRVYVGEVYDANTRLYYRGRVNMDGVEMKNFGQSNTTLAGLTFERLTSTSNSASVVKRSVVRDSWGYEMRITGSNDVTVENNLFFRSYRIQVQIEGENKNIKFKNNLLIANEDRGLKSDQGDVAYDFSAALYADAKFTSSEISGNIISGCYQQCLFTRGGDCSTQAEGPYTVFNNIVHSGQVGWLVKDPNEKCNGVSHFTGYKLEQGIASMFQSQKIQGSNLIISDTTKGISLNLGGILEPTSVSLKNSYVVGITPTGDIDGYANKDECSNITGVMIPVSVESPKTIPPKPSSLPWYKVKTNHIWQSTFTVTGVTFENFAENIVAGCTNNFAFESNHYASDNSAITKVSGLTLLNVAQNSKIYFEKPEDGWIGVDDCGGWFCTGISNILVRDLDGSLTGKTASLMPANSQTIDNNACTFNEKENANICTDKAWGLLTFESMDSDVLTRIISPVKVNSTGYETTLNSYMDHVWDGFYTGLKRYSRFHAVVKSQAQYQVEFTGTVPNGMRWAYQGGLPQESVSVVYGYENPQSVKITDKTGKVINPTIVKATEATAIKTTDPCGTNLYNVDERKIIIQLTGEDNCRLDVVLTNAIKATIRYSMTVEEFFAQNGPAAFIDKMAAVLKINPASIRIVEVKSGSTIINFFVDSSFQDNTKKDDQAAKVELNTMVNVLTTAVASGDLKILNSEILNSSFDVALLRPVDTPSETEVITSGNNFIIIIIAAVVGTIALIIGSYLAYKRYTKKRIAPSDMEPKHKGGKIFPDISATMNTEHILVTTSRFDLSQAPSAVRDLSPIIIEDYSPEKP